MGDLFLVGRADIFAIYPKILKELLQIEDLKRLSSKDGVLPKDFIYLPSDGEFQERVYYRLLEVQKEINDLIESGMPAEEIAAKRDKPIWDPETITYQITPIISPSSSSSAKRRKCIADDPIGFLNMDTLNVWSLEDLTKAGRLLRKPPLKCEFFDEHEMRRVYSIIYDVFRYKHILNQAFYDVAFYAYYPESKQHKNRLWLLLYDLYLRHFLKRDPKERIKQKHLYKEADLDVLDKNIWAHKINLAAAISRLRIKNSALTLAELLPLHLQDDKVAIAAANPIITGWINPCKMRTKNGARNCMTVNGFRESEENDDGQTALEHNSFKWDKVCPLFLSCIPLQRTIFSKSDLLQNNEFIIQDRSFSFGPALCSRLLDYFEIEGDIVQTQVSSPKSTAYLAALFQCNTRVNDLIVFGAGAQIEDYKRYMNELGIRHVIIYAENFCNINLNSPILEKVVGIFATPPNSYSGVTDPIDLICSRGGDLTMLEVLTESEMSDNGKKRVAQVLEEQRETLRLSMSRPQVQFVLYETHSIVETENETMVKKSVTDINKSAQTKHIKLYKEKRRLEAIAEQEGISVEQWEKLQGLSTGITKRKLKQPIEDFAQKYICESESSANSSDESETEGLETSRSRLSKKSGTTPSDDYFHIKIPKTDLFEIVPVPDICLFQDKCVRYKDHGCFLSLMKRKHVTRLDEKYLILMAERRGLFGDTSPKKGAKLRSQTKLSKKEEKQKASSTTPKIMKRKKSDDITDLINRLAQPTHSSIIRCQMLRKSSANDKLLLFSSDQCRCQRFKKRQDDADEKQFLSSRARKWWTETTNYINSSRMHQNVSKDVKADKMPPLRLTRNLTEDQTKFVNDRKFNYDRDSFPVATNIVRFHEYRTPKLNFSNVPIFVEKCHQTINYSTRIRKKPYETQLYPSLLTSYSSF